ncbi:cell wall-binding repeat-containing protein [Patulibacter americanus]|uniref:cell wall-binding repeat-containing protein n=1 Tax=Patulibacter americanus TaxID=588672 RepID=UPI0004252337|nr:cell wall-binding repeat-containing protein [Patulibacter americanus]
MVSYPPLRRRIPGIALPLAAGALALAGCGGGDASPSPFTTPAGESKATSDVGIPLVATRDTTRTATDDPVVAAAAVARAAFPGGAPSNQAKAVTIVDRRDWRSALAATALVAPPIGAPVLFGDGAKLPEATTQAIGALRPTGSEAAGGAQAIRVGDVGRPPGLRTTDIAGADPYETARAIDRFTTAVRNRVSPRVLVVSADNPEFAAPAAAWLAKSGDPVAFVTKTGIPPATARQLAAHPKATLYVLGPSAVVPPAVTKKLRAYGTVRRVGGLTPVSNAVGFARYDDGDFGWNVNTPGHGFTVARTTDVLGAISLAPLSTSGLHGPLLLLDDAARMPTEVRDYLLDIQPGFYADDPDRDATQAGGYNRAWLTGDGTAITPNLQAQLDALLEIAPVSTEANPTASSVPSTGTAPAPPAGTSTTGRGTGTTGTGASGAPTPAP